MSSDGASWRDALKVERGSGIVHLSSRPAVFDRVHEADRLHGAGKKPGWSAVLDNGSLYRR